MFGELFVNFSTVAVVSFLLTVIISKIVIPILKGHKIGQSIREEGPKDHKIKAGTPTMGGICFIMASLIALSAIAIVYAVLGKQEELVPLALTLVLALSNGLIGFIDDYCKLIKKQNEGLTPRGKLILQTLAAGLYILGLCFFGDLTTALPIPFTEVSLELGWLYYAFAIFLIVGVVNSVNLTDGLDGLATSVTIIVMAFFAVVSLVFENASLVLLSGAVIGGLFGFLIFNAHPAKVFMGDTGSLFLGGAVVGAAFLVNQPLIIVIVGGIYIFEAVSVMIQVGVYKLTKKRPEGPKRVFRMTPVHHHFELGGWRENKIVLVFSLVTLLLAAIAWFGL